MLTLNDNIRHTTLRSQSWTTQRGKIISLSQPFAYRWKTSRVPPPPRAARTPPPPPPGCAYSSLGTIALGYTLYKPYLVWIRRIPTLNVRKSTIMEFEPLKSIFYMSGNIINKDNSYLTRYLTR